MKMNDNTILRIKVPAHLYEAVKAQLTLKEGKNDYGMPGAKTIKEKKTSDSKPKAASERPKNTSAPKKANAPQKATGAMYDKETSKLGAGVSETKKMGLEELHALAELLHAEIAKLEEKAEGKEEKAPVEEVKEVEKNKVEESTEEQRKIEKQEAEAALLNKLKTAFRAGKKLVKKDGTVIKSEDEIPTTFDTFMGRVTIDGNSPYATSTLPKAIPDKYRGSETLAGFRTGD